MWPFSQNRKKPKDVAKQRLKLAIFFDRKKINPKAVDAIKEAIIEALSRFPFVDTRGIKIHAFHQVGDDKIEIEVPVKGEDEEEEE